ncbi:MazG-like family protein [Clostridium weizhouense]|uniref:MazG-like family protein n=1 Tax=Clostridium weizhouense TaxID=2859781 RepID=A0ABS7ASZ3_9CLOT|nr:MazG-like family protein [Clostridium weizhouense]MBW6411789.1 MazG-like family protein [Clostridium weizhouense]
MKKEELNIMTSVKIIENLKAQLLCIVGEFFRLLTKGNNIAHNSILDCISGAISILYVLAEKLGYSFAEVDHTMKKKLELGIRAEDEVEKDGRSLSRLKLYIDNRRD